MARKPKQPTRPIENDPEVDEVTELEEQTPQEAAREILGSADKPQEGLPSRETLQDMFTTKSAAIRYLINKGFTVKVIAKHLDLRYQHVRNVATSELKRGPNEDWRGPEFALPKSPKPD